ncbi:hypothetical protein ACGFNV_06200 [Streptomyces sp. NPDC048751]|uniref:hypothetical protein n=1 Tax=Streptomyces sp. NPDC048751 TaxID=3365591 RepID=UPI00371AA3C8
MTTRSPESHPNRPPVFPTAATEATGAAGVAQTPDEVSRLTTLLGERAGVRLVLRSGRNRRPRGAGPTAGAPSWPTWLTVAALAICGAAHFPASRDGASLQVYGFAFGASVLCVLLALLLTFRSTAVLLAGAVVVPAALVTARLFQDQWHAAGLSRALSLTLAPSWLATSTAVLATLTALLALIVAEPAGRRPAAAPNRTTEASRPGD